MRSTSVEVAYNGVYGDRLGMDIGQSYVPEEFYASGNARNTAQQTLLQGNVTNPLHISNFESLRTSNPELYQRLAGNSFFTSRTIQRQYLLRAFPGYGNTGETYERVPSLWQPSNSARPHRLSGSGMADLPFGPSKPFLNNGGVLAAVVGDWQLSGTFEYQPGQLLNWNNNIFF